MSTDLETLTDETLTQLWPQAAGGLRGFAGALERGNSGLTAAQLRLAVQMADAYYAQRTGAKAGEADRMEAVKRAREAKVCRICAASMRPFTESMTYNFGHEYAHTACLEQAKADDEAKP